MTSSVINSNVSNGYLAYGCFQKFDKIACSRDVIEVVLALFTVIFCLVKIVKLHLAKHGLLNQYLIFYAAVLEIILLALNWLYVQYAAIDLVAELLKLFQFLVVCRFYCAIASRMTNTETFYKRYFHPALALIFMYFITLIIVGFALMTKNIDECIEPEWLLLSCSEVALGILFIVVGVYITREVNCLKTDSSYKRHVRISLWGIIISFELSSVIAMAYDVIMLFIGKENHCKGLFVNNIIGFTASHIIVKILKWLLPIWAMMIVFKPDSFKSDADLEDNSNEPPIVQRSLGGGYVSEFRPRAPSFKYKHLRNPENESDRQLLRPDNYKSTEPISGKADKKSRRKQRQTKNSTDNQVNASSSINSTFVVKANVA